jgi:hypothetical protein
MIDISGSFLDTHLCLHWQGWLVDHEHVPYEEVPNDEVPRRPPHVDPDEDGYMTRLIRRTCLLTVQMTSCEQMT